MAGFRQTGVDVEKFCGLTQNSELFFSFVLLNYCLGFGSSLILLTLIFGQLSTYSFTSGRIHTLITSGFSNVGTSQIILNMIGLYYFGTRV